MPHSCQVLIENPVNYRVDALANDSAVYIFLVHYGGGGYVKCAPALAIEFRKHAVQRQRHDTVYIGHDGLFRPMVEDFMRGHVFDICKGDNKHAFNQNKKTGSPRLFSILHQNHSKFYRKN